MKQTATAEVMFMAWGQWQRGGTGNYTINIIGRCMDEGAGASHTTVPGEAHMPPMVEVVERFCLTLPNKYRYAINHRYIYDSPDSHAAKKLHCSVDTYRNRLDLAAGELEKYIVEN